MSKETAYCVVFVTASSKLEARRIAAGLLEKHLIACANIVPGLESHYWWQGKLERSSEWLLIVKTRRSLFSKVERQVKQLHSYEVPEIIALPIIAGQTNYLRWIGENTKATV